MTDLLLDQIEIDLLNGNLRSVLDRKDYINCYITNILAVDRLTDQEVKALGQLVHIGNIVYHNSDLNEEEQPIESGVYDILLEKYKIYNPNFQVGAEPVVFKDIQQIKPSLDAIPMVIFLPEDKVNKMLYQDEIFNNPPVMREDISEPMVTFAHETSKKYRDTAHSNIELVGSLDKCKYVLNAEAIEKGVFEDPSVKVLERDFFGVQFSRGIINNNTIFRIMLELKYDGTSVVVSIMNGMVVKAESRGDTGMDKATDFTPILYGYRFPHLPDNVCIDVKCEAVMTYRNLYLYNQAKGKTYANCRSAINGLFSSNDGYLYQKYITLVPLKVAHSSIVDDNSWDTVDRLTEIEFMNKYLRSGEILRHAYIEGDYTTVLFLIKKFVEEAEFARDIMPTMYDGVVVSYVDEELIKILGRENFINKYSVAVKFNALKKRTIFRGYKFTVGQDGKITPMAYYDPVEFMGTIHNKSSVSSYDRFMSLSLKIGDPVYLEYRHEVMPYLTKSEEEFDNPNPIEEFPKNCPSCDFPLKFSDSGKTAICDFPDCKESNIQRVSNMMDKLGLKDFSVESMKKIFGNKGGLFMNLTYLMNLTRDELIPILGDVNSYKFIERMNQLKNNPIYDYIIVGSLGFDGIAQETWKKIFKVFTLKELLEMRWNTDGPDFTMSLLAIKGIGDIIEDTIYYGMMDVRFSKDLNTIVNMPNIISSKGLSQRKIRCTGFRDKELMNQLCDLGFDADDNKSVTKDTYILLVPSEGHTSSKTKAAGPDTLIIPVREFRDNIDKYI